MKKPLSILLVAASTTQIETIQTVLQGSSDFRIMYVLHTADHWIQACNESKPDVCIFSPETSIPHCLYQIQDLHALTNAVHCLVVVDAKYANHARTAISSGADGFLSTQFLSSDLQHALSTIAQGHLYCKTFQENIGSDNHDTPNRLVLLSQREVEALQLIAYGYTYQDIAEKLRISVKSVETYRARISKKLCLDTRAKMVRFALDHHLLSKDRIV
ncbi:MAG: response regulator transcription factor [Deltaproteobacteria bacterium]|nr:response regulator transcription factor [Deltaproteobacteria bacterium]